MKLIDKIFNIIGWLLTTLFVTILSLPDDNYDRLLFIQRSVKPIGLQPMGSSH